MEEGKLHLVQEAFIEHDALQCGYCMAGMIMAIKALLDRNPRPTLDEVRSVIGGSYPYIINATLDASRKIVFKEGNEGMVESKLLVK
ncbi:MAG: 2Fe-2S iron-sulfur cluster-binding protein [Thermodesulfobacteriota bacterium]